MDIPNQRWAHEPIHKKPHKSLLRVCNVFGILVVMNLPVQLMTVMMCLALTDGSVFGMVALLSKFLFEVSVSVAIVTSLFSSTLTMKLSSLTLLNSLIHLEYSLRLAYG